VTGVTPFKLSADRRGCGRVAQSLSVSGSAVPGLETGEKPQSLWSAKLCTAGFQRRSIVAFRLPPDRMPDLLPAFSGQITC